MVFETRPQDLCFEGSWERPLDGINVCPTVVERGTFVVQRGTSVVGVWLWMVDFESGKNVKEQFLLFVSRVSDAH